MYILLTFTDRTSVFCDALMQIPFANMICSWFGTDWRPNCYIHTFIIKLCYAVCHGRVDNLNTRLCFRAIYIDTACLLPDEQQRICTYTCMYMYVYAYVYAYAYI